MPQSKSILIKHFLNLDDGQTCDLAYEMFECVSEKIDEVCIILQNIFDEI